MKILLLFFILLFTSIVMSLKIPQAFRMDFEQDVEKSSPIEFDTLLYELLSFLQQKLIDNTFTNDDMHVFGVILQFVFKTNENLKRRRMKEQTVYWLSRQGR